MGDRAADQEEGWTGDEGAVGPGGGAVDEGAERGGWSGGIMGTGNGHGSGNGNGGW